MKKLSRFRRSPSRFFPAFLCGWLGALSAAGAEDPAPAAAPAEERLDPAVLGPLKEALDALGAIRVAPPEFYLPVEEGGAAGKGDVPLCRESAKEKPRLHRLLNDRDEEFEDPAEYEKAKKACADSIQAYERLRPALDPDFADHLSRRFAGAGARTALEAFLLEELPTLSDPRTFEAACEKRLDGILDLLKPLRVNLEGAFVDEKGNEFQDPARHEKAVHDRTEARERFKVLDVRLNSEAFSRLWARFDEAADGSVLQGFYLAELVRVTKPAVTLSAFVKKIKSSDSFLSGFPKELERTSDEAEGRNLRLRVKGVEQVIFATARLALDSRGRPVEPEEGKVVVDALSGLLGEAGEETRRRLLMALGQTGQPAAVRCLLDAAGRGRTAEDQASALNPLLALAASGTAFRKEDWKAVRGLAKDGASPGVQALAIDVFRSALVRRSGGPPPAEVTGEFLDYLLAVAGAREKGDPDSALRCLVRFPEDSWDRIAPILEKKLLAAAPLDQVRLLADDMLRQRRFAAETVPLLLPLYEKAHAERNDQVHVRVWETLRKTSGKDLPNDLAAWKEWWEANRETEVNRLRVHILDSLKGDKP